MRWLITTWLLLLLPANAGCGAGDDNGLTNADQADGVSASSSAAIDGAARRVLVKLASVSDTKLNERLTAAVARGVDVEAYFVAAAPADGATVLAQQAIEANGVDVKVDRVDQLAGLISIIDDQATFNSGSGTRTSVDVAEVKAAEASFRAALAEPLANTPTPDLPPSKLALLPMPDSGPSTLARLIHDAQVSIDLSMYQLEDPALISELRAAAQHLPVRVMLEPETVGARNFAMASAALRSAGVIVTTTPPAFSAGNKVDHAKFMIIDDRELVFSTGNMLRSGLGGHGAPEFNMRDFWVRDARPASVQAARVLFDADLARNTTTNLRAADVQALQAAFVLTPDNARGAITNLIAGANQRLFIYNQTLKDNALIGKIASKQAGVDVRVLLGFQPGFGGGPPDNQKAIDTLRRPEAPRSVAFYTRHYLHAKVVVADGRAFVGSQNFSSGGLDNNRELGEIINDPTIVDQLATMFQADADQPSP
jgi:hypothetical protein